MAFGAARVATMPRGVFGRATGAGAASDARPDVAVIFPRSFSSAIRALRAGARIRIGIADEGRAFLLTRRVAIGWPARTRHIADEFAEVARAAGASPQGVPRLAVPAQTLDAARAALRAAGVRDGAPVLAIAAGAAFGPAKRWFADRFADVASRAASAGAAPVLVGSAADRDVAADLARAASAPLVDLTGRTSLPLLAGILATARVVLSNDSGPMHLAAAVGTPVVALFGSTNPSWTAPLGAGHEILRYPMPCAPCYRRTCPIGRLCFDGIAPARVWDAVAARLG
jgi:heptosyltransferase-2